MESLSESVREYTAQLEKGHIQRAYRGILSFMSALKLKLEAEYPNYTSGGIYPGYMDMSYLAFTPPLLKEKGLKIAVVYLHRENRFDLWLAGGNRGIQTRYFRLFQELELPDCRFSKPGPGVDSIVERILVQTPDFDDAEALMRLIGEGVVHFAEQMAALLADTAGVAAEE